MELNVQPIQEGQRGRKRTRNPSEWKKNKAKVARYSAKNAPQYPHCNHSQGAYQCKQLSMRDVMNFNKLYYKRPDKQHQDHFVLKHVEISNCKRRRPNQSKNVENPKSYGAKLRTTKYFVRSVNREKVPVCLETFKNILQVSRFRLNRITAKFHEKGFIQETRGGFKKNHIYQPKRECVMKFINSLKCVESHYCRGKSLRKYLSSELNVKKLWRLYSSKPNNLPVKVGYFREIFNIRYNLAFGTPRTDVCSLCLELSEKLKREVNPAKRNALLTEKRVHRLRYKAFYDKLSDPEESILIISFDCQKNLAMPKVPDQSTYYSRQVYVHNFTIVKGNSKAKLGTDNVAYCWTENEFSKDSNLIASCLHDFLTTTDLTGFNKIRLVSDGCSGQNKNSAIVAMVSSWLGCENENPEIKEVEIVYPVTGHSFLPPDRVFGNIEKDLRRKEIIVNPAEVYSIIRQHATLKVVGEDMKVYDYKIAKENVLKDVKNWHFQISKQRRIYIKKKSNNMCTVRGELSYRADIGVYKRLTKVGKTIKDIIPIEMKKKNELNVNKKVDVDKLLKKHYGNDWRQIPELKFYELVVDNSTTAVEHNNDLCEEQQDELNLII